MEFQTKIVIFAKSNLLIAIGTDGFRVRTHKKLKGNKILSHHRKTR